MHKLRGVIVFLAALAAVVYSVEVKKIEVSNYHQFQKGRLDGVNLASAGILTIGSEIRKTGTPDREYLLSFDIAPNGDILLGTGHEGSVFTVRKKDGEEDVIEQIFQADQLDIYALLALRNNDVLVGTSPNGIIYRISADKKISEFFNPGEKYIWDLKEDKTGNILCAVGNNGAVYSITPGGVAVKIFAAEDMHIVSLFVSRDNSILAGSGDRGILYEIKNRKAKVLYDSPLDEIRGIYEDEQGYIYFSATQGVSNIRSNKNPVLDSLFKDSGKTEITPPPEKSILYCRPPDGVVEEIWSSREDYIYCLHYDSAQQEVIVGTGNSGRIYRVSRDERYSLLYESDSAQIFKLLGHGNGITMIANNTADIVEIRKNLRSRGEYVSEIFDLGMESKLGRMYWEAQAPQGKGVSLFIRAGNSNIPDEATWTQWSAPFTDSENSNINWQGYRYVQVKVVLNSMNLPQSPSLYGFRFYYLQANLKPKIKDILIQRSWQIPVKPAKPGEKPLESTQLKISWRAVDPNRDALTFHVFIRKAQDENWILIKKNLTIPEWIFNSRLYEDGRYYMKVEVDDSRANPPDQAQTGRLISQSFIVDSTAPQVVNLAINDSSVRFDVVDTTSRIHKVLFSLDGEEWTPVFPIDAINDSLNESYVCRIGRSSGSRYLFIRVEDEYRNFKVFQKTL